MRRAEDMMSALRIKVNSLMRKTLRDFSATPAYHPKTQIMKYTAKKIKIKNIPPQPTASSPRNVLNNFSSGS